MPIYFKTFQTLKFIQISTIQGKMARLVFCLMFYNVKKRGQKAPL